MSEHHFLAIDFGAESGRGILVTLAGDQVSMEEIHRWPNRRVTLAGTVHWDVPFLFAEMLEAMRLAAQRHVSIAGMSIDTWGVDFGLLGEDGKLLGIPVSYRDGRTENIHDYANPTLGTDRIFELTGYEPWALSSLYQLLAMQRDNAPTLPVARTFLNMPDLFNYFLTGRAASEMSIANTTNLMDTDRQWSRPIIEAFDLPEMFVDLVEPGTVIGPLRAEVIEATGLDCPLVAVCGHDTSAALAAVPAEGENWAFLSCGTWSILGGLVDKPVATSRCLELGFTNEYTYGSWYLARNILGLWLVQELRRKWDTPDDPWDYSRMTAQADTDDAESYTGLIDVADESLMAPDDMEAALHGVLRANDQPLPETRGQLIRSVLSSLALEYNWRMDTLGELTGAKADTLYIVGGGIANQLLCQFTADACGMDVHAGADQCTALGNALIAAAGLDIIDGPDAIRQIMRASTQIKTYHPQDPSRWESRREQYNTFRQA